MMNWARLHPGYRREYRKALARSTPLIDGPLTKRLARVMGYDADLLEEVADDAGAQVAAAKKAADPIDQQIKALQDRLRSGKGAPAQSEKALEDLRARREKAVQQAYQAGRVPLEPRDTYPSRLQAWIRERGNSA